MRLQDPKVWLAGTSLALVLLLFAMDFERTSPGPLSAAHASVAGLDGKGSCSQCHGGWLTSMKRACLECHAEIEEQLEAGKGLHGKHLATVAEPELVDRCASCHLEHHGAELELSGPGAFRQAGFADPQAFDHPHVDFGLVGRHEQLACKQCHQNAETELLIAGQTRYLGLEQSCTACHEDPHESRFARGCESCHGQERPFGEVESFVHGDAFPLVGAHARPTCQDCHAQGSIHEIEALAGHVPSPPARTCLDCHESPHRPEFTASAGLLLGREPGNTCAACHAAERGPFGGDTRSMDPALHAASGFALSAPHARAACEQCHEAEGATPVRPSRLAAAPALASAAFAARFPGRSADACEACHDDPHGGQFEDLARESRTCLSCHERESFEPPRFGLEEHARTSFPLEESHAAVSCNECHQRPRAPDDGPRLFHGTPGGCVACHLEAHESSLGGAFATAAQRREEQAEGCGECHVPTLFSEVDRAGFDHLRWTAFALDGAHARADCESCHARSQQPEPDGRTFGRAARAFGAPLDRCESCHADAHRGFFEDERLAREVGGRQGCARCHVTDGFREGPAASFDHAEWTAFALDGAHARATCGSCHGAASPALGGPVASARAFGFVRDRAQLGTGACEACHEDPHGGRFAPAGELVGEARQGCEDCHTTESFAQVDRAAFDHERVTGFALVGEHERAACETCHAPGLGLAPGALHLGRARGTDCAACHVDPHVGQFAAEGRTDCAACHLAQKTFHDLDFDHQRDTRFALDQRHTGLACSACHVPWPLKSGAQAVRYKPLGTQCIDCHDHGGRQGGKTGLRKAAGGGKGS